MSIIDLEDAVRAAQDRPSMEKELQDLRQRALRYEIALSRILDVEVGGYMATGKCMCCIARDRIAAAALKGEGE